VLAVGLALASAVCFAGMTIALRFGLQTRPDADLGALLTAAVGLVVATPAAALGGGSLGGARDLGVFAAAGLLAPGASGLLFTHAVRTAGPSRASVVAGGAPLVAATIALTVLGEPAEAGILVGGALIVLGGFALLSERRRPDAFRAIGIVFAIASTIFFATRDNVARAYLDDTTVEASVGAAVSMAAGAAVVLVYLAVKRRGMPAIGRADLRAFLPAGVFFGLSYVLLFEAFDRDRVTVISPLVATESLWTVVLAAVLLRRSELVGPRLVGGACLVVAGSALIGVFR
jgi:drug/metabolite transporter (DMT)-like permease